MPPIPSADRPELTFFCELEPTPLEELFASPKLIETLLRLKARVSLGLIDLSAERAGIVQRLNQAGVPVTAWLLLPLEQGYYFNLDNTSAAAERYHTFLDWTQAYSLCWHALGLDIEPDLRGLRELAGGLRGAGRFLRQAMKPVDRIQRGVAAYQHLVDGARRDGFVVESYQFPFILDERRAGSRLVQRVTGVLDLPVDREVLMLYSSFYPSIGAGLVWSFGQEAKHIAIGSTGGGVTVAGLANPDSLTWENFRRDLLLCTRLTRSLYIFSLEGCVQQGFLKRLESFDWQGQVNLPEGEARQVSRVRGLLRGALRFSRLFV